MQNAEKPYLSLYQVYMLYVNKLKSRDVKYTRNEPERTLRRKHFDAFSSRKIQFGCHYPDILKQEIAKIVFEFLYLEFGFQKYTYTFYFESIKIDVQDVAIDRK